ncbi:MAG: hypothetical protein GY757_31485, partial [bacterium]|nr:hypothetical protein [bacterium]
DINGNLVTQIDAKGEILGKISFKYDKLNRATVKHGADTVYYCYDGLVNDRSASDGKNHGVSVNGQLTSLYFGSGDYKEDYFYNDKDKKYEITKTIDGKEKTYSSTLDELGRIKEETYPDKDKEKLLYTYNYSGNIDSFFGTYENNQLSDNYIYELRYNIFGKIISFNQGNWSKTIYKYNDKNRLSNINITNRTGIIADMTFEYDGYGNINKKVFRDGFENYFTEDFSYDSLFRLEEAVSNGLYGTKTYTYDSYNNMTGNDGRTYNYDGNNLPHAVSKVVDKNGNDQKIYEYDVNGNVTRITGQSRLVVKAKGTGVDVNPPRMELWINGDASGKPEMVWTVSDTDYKIFTWNGHIPAGASIDIVFANDNHDDDVDTNLYVEFISVNDNMIHSTSSGVVYDRGYGSERFDGENTIPGQEGMAWTGALRFPMPVSALAPVKTLGYDRENRLVSITDDSMSSTFGYNDVGQRIWKIENSSVIEDNKLVEKRIKTYYFFDKYEEEYDITGGEDELVQSIKYYFA